ncbi:MAG: four-carbon acid sugar kinase family protein [Vannielia sp.]|uniref:3-oxo-tetronate kinase n=1 Tax=Vannielia sp. TaxID=2813045 RepID=UPI003B8B55BF
MAIFGAIADDFTGATDLAGLLARSGAKVSLRIGVPESGESDAPFEVIALKIRTEPVAEAVSEALSALDWLKGTGAERFFWKYCSTFDSTPQGNIGPVAEALMAALGAEQTVYCPAFPENGRSVFMGNLFVGQQPLAESPMKDHPLTPMRDSNLMRLLAPQVTREVGLVDRLTVARGAAALAEALAKAPPHVVVDAVADADLQVIASAGRDMALMTGGSALAMPLPALYREAGLLDDSAREARVPQVGPGAVVLSGSCSAMTRAQVAAYGGPAFKLDPLGLAKEGNGAASEWLAGQDMGAAPILYATAEPDEVRRAQGELGTARAGAVVEEALAALAVQAREQGARRIVVAGGETSGAVTKALGVTRLDVGREIAPGVPWCGCVSGGQEIALALKSGNFGAETFFADALGMLP